MYVYSIGSPSGRGDLINYISIHSKPEIISGRACDRSGAGKKIHYWQQKSFSIGSRVKKIKEEDETSPRVITRKF